MVVAERKSTYGDDKGYQRGQILSETVVFFFKGWVSLRWHPAVTWIQSFDIWGLLFWSEKGTNQRIHRWIQSTIPTVQHCEGGAWEHLNRASEGAVCRTCADNKTASLLGPRRPRPCGPAHILHTEAAAVAEARPRALPCVSWNLCQSHWVSSVEDAQWAPPYHCTAGTPPTTHTSPFRLHWHSVWLLIPVHRPLKAPISSFTQSKVNRGWVRH